MKIGFFVTLALQEMLQDKESIDLKIQRTGDEYTVLVSPHIKGKTSNIVMSGTPEELDEGFIDEISKPIERIKGLKSNADSSSIEESDDDDEKEVVNKRASQKKEVVKKEEKKETKTSEKTKAFAEKSEKHDQEANVKADDAQAKQEAIEKEKLNKERFDKLVAAAVIAKEKCENILVEKYYTEACELFPEDKKIVEMLQKTIKYNNAMIAADLLPTRDQWEKEVKDGISS